MQLDLATKGDVWTKYSIGRPQNNFSLLPVTTVWIGKVVPCLLIEKKKKVSGNDEKNQCLKVRKTRLFFSLFNV